MAQAKKGTNKKEQTTAEFVERMGKQGTKRRGSKVNFSWKR